MAVLGLVVGTRPLAGSAVEYANPLFRSLHEATVDQTMVLPNPFDFRHDASLGEVRICPFSPETFMFWAKRAQVQYPVDYRSESVHRAAVIHVHHGLTQRQPHLLGDAVLTPQWILPRDALYERNVLRGNSWTTRHPMGTPPSKQPIALTMPTNDRVRLDDDKPLLHFGQ